MKYQLKVIIPLLCMLFFTFSYAQVTADSIKNSTNTGSADKAVQLIIKSDSIAAVDSISKAILIKQLEDLHSTERFKRLKIESELEWIRQKDSSLKAEMLDEINRLKMNARGYPVIPHKDTLFTIYTKIGSLSPPERSNLINERLTKLYEVFFQKADSLNIIDNGQSLDLYFKDRVILSVTELDAMWFGLPKKEIIAAYKEKILSDIAIYKNNRSFFKRIREIGLVLLVILIQVLLIIGINYLFKKIIAPYLLSKSGIWFNGIKLKNYELFSQERETEVVIILARLIRYTIIILLLYLSIPVLFLIFPPTQRIAETLFGYTIAPFKIIGFSFISYIPDLISIAVIIFVTHYILKFLKFLSYEIADEKIHIPGFFPDWAKTTYNIVKIFILAFMFVVIFPHLPGSDKAVFKGVSVFIGIVFSLGSTSVIGNMVAGLVLTYMRPFKIGDRIKIGDVIGNVVEKTPFVTRIRTPKKEFITIPNSNILSSNVTNYSNSKLQGGLVIHTTVTIGYDVPWRKVHQILIKAAKQTSSLNLEIAPFVLQTSLDDFYVSYQLNAHTYEPDKQPGIYSELHQNIQDGFNEGGIEILSPHYRAARDGNPMAVPKDYLPEDYKSPGFKITKEE